MIQSAKLSHDGRAWKLEFKKGLSSIILVLMEVPSRDFAGRKAVIEMANNRLKKEDQSWQENCCKVAES